MPLMQTYPQLMALNGGSAVRKAGLPMLRKVSCGAIVLKKSLVAGRRFG
jgi:hypothetical protein